MNDGQTAGKDALAEDIRDALYMARSAGVFSPTHVSRFVAERLVALGYARVTSPALGGDDE